MSLKSGTGANLRLEVNPSNGKLRPVWSGGNWDFDDRMVEVIFSLLVEDEGWSTDGRRRGPSLRSVDFGSVDAPARLKVYAEQRLQLAIDDGRLRSVEVTVEAIGRTGAIVHVSYVTRAGRRDLVDVPLGALR